MKKLISILLLTLILTFTFIRPVLALNPWEYARDIYSPAVYDDPNINLQKHVKETLAIIPWAMADLILNIILPKGIGTIATCSQGLTGTSFTAAATCISDTLNALGNLFTQQLAPEPVADTSIWSESATLNNLRSSFTGFASLASSVHAQGYGYNSFPQSGAVLTLWTAVRNAAYLLSAFALIIAGIMIMFRVKLSPQVVITIEQMIPKFVITLLLITFSYAIAGFLIDLSYVVEYLISSLIGSANIVIQGMDCCTTTQTFKFYADRAAGSALLLSFSAIILLIKQVFVILGNFFTIGGILGLLGGIIFFIFVFLALFINIVRILLDLSKAYVSLIVNLIFGPLIILAGMLPGAGGFSTWFNNYVKSLVVFPVASTMFVLGFILAGSAGFSGGWSPAIIGGTGDLALVIAGFSVILAIPGAVKMVDAFFAKKPFDLGTAAGEAMAPARGGIFGTLSKEFGRQISANESTRTRRGPGFVNEGADRAMRIMQMFADQARGRG